jgi:hypothetical protein
MAKKTPKLPLPDFQYIDAIVRRLRQNEGNLFTLPDGTQQEGYLLEFDELEPILFVLMRLSDYVHKRPPGPKSYNTFWEAYAGAPKFKQYLEEAREYVRAAGKEHGARTSALGAIVGDDPYKQAALGKQIDKWSKLPLFSSPEQEDALRKKLEKIRTRLGDFSLPDE